MKIGFDASDLCTGRADGTTRFTGEVLKRLPGLLPHDEVHVFAPCDKEMPGTIWHSSPFPKFWTQLRLPLSLFSVRPHALFMPIQQLPIIRPPRMRTVSVVHDLAFHMYPDQFTYKDWLLLHAFTAQVAHEADEIIAVSQSTADDIAKYYGRTKNVHVVHHGVDHNRFHTKNIEANWNVLQKQFPQLKKPYLLFVGQIQPRKNLVRLVAAFEEVKSKHPELQLVIASGHGWLQEKTLERIQASRFADNIHMLGRVSDELLPALYQHAAVFVLVSMYEGFGLPALEALACGAPVVASNTSSLPEVVGDVGVLVNPSHVPSIRDGIMKALQDPQTFRKAGPIQASKFTWDNTTQKIVDILHKNS